MNIKIAGASGFLGKIVSGKLEAEGHKISAISRELLYGSINNLMDYLSGTDVVINLAGAPIIKRWTSGNKKEIYSSRIITTKNIALAIKKIPAQERPQKVLSASAIGIYSPCKRHTEISVDYENGFIGNLVAKWEAAWLELPEETDLSIFRIGLVLGKKARLIKNLSTIFKLGIGGKIGTGKQPFPFIHEKDLARAFSFVLKRFHGKRIINLVAPQQIDNSHFVKVFAKKLNKPALIPVPSFALKILFGKSAGLLTQSPAVIPGFLQSENFTFYYPTIEDTLKEILE